MKLMRPPIYVVLIDNPVPPQRGRLGKARPGRAEIISLNMKMY